jgi:alkanesulfonate monooxygenase SsuD/methylene tetrahydromethanopterin reductase-like flavin-dependent oxidoreductase (luciferase family)
MLGYNVFAAVTDEQGAFLASSIQQAFVELRSGRPSQLKPPIGGYLESLAPIQRAQLEAALSYSAVGSPAAVKAAVENFVEQTRADELMVTSQIFDHEARLRSYELLASCW